MQCMQCGFVAPTVYQTAQQTKELPPCAKCGGPTRHSAEELISDPALGLVREIRPGQIELTKIIDKGIREPGQASLFVQGGCGCGKTYSYLVPALLSGKRIVVVTAKKSLQDQLEVKDIPYLREKLGVPETFVSIKGKANYICRKQLRNNEGLFRKMNRGALWEELTEWADEAEGVHFGDLNSFPGDTPFPVSTATAEECSGVCGYARKNGCGYRYLKEKSKEAQLVVANHSLLGFDLRFANRVFMPYNILVVDEAHACPDFLRRAFSQEVSQTWLKTFLRKVGRAQIDTPSVDETKALRKWDALFATVPEGRLLPTNFFDPVALKAVTSILDDLVEDFADHAVERWLDRRRRPFYPGGRPGMAVVVKDCEEIILQQAEYFDEDDDGDNAELDELNELIKFYNKTSDVKNVLNATTKIDENFINCREPMREGKIRIVRQPVNLAPYVSDPLKNIDKTIFTSATLGNKLLKHELGVEPKVEVNQPSPFNFKANSICYLPQHLPRPDEEAYHFAVAEEIHDLTQASRGNALVLFSSKKDMGKVLEEIEENYDMTDTPIFAQVDGTSPKEVMRSFEETDNSIIFGLRSFFEGIDVQGMKLRLVILAKIPFPPREDPLTQAKQSRLGDKWWSEYYFPTMLNDIQQAAGRLIRTQTDRGIFAILDVRMWTGKNKNIDPREVGTKKRKWVGYGKNIFVALPFENHTPNKQMVVRYLTRWSQQTQQQTQQQAQSQHTGNK